MRHTALGRHTRPPQRVRLASYVLAFLAAVALFLSLAFLTSPASAAPAVTAGPVARIVPVAVTGQDKAVITAARIQAAAAARARAVQAAAAVVYTVRPGDSISRVARLRCGAERFWTGIYAASRKRGWTARNASNLTPGQHLRISCTLVPGMAGRAYTPPAPRVILTAVRTKSSDRSEHAAVYQASTYHGSGSMQQCIIARESGGNSQVMNSTSHYGLYQFSASTWAAHGGNPADFGHASVAEQNQVYYNTVAADGYSDWSPYDGC